MENQSHATEKITREDNNVQKSMQILMTKMVSKLSQTRKKETSAMMTMTESVAKYLTFKRQSQRPGYVISLSDLAVSRF